VICDSKFEKRIVVEWRQRRKGGSGRGDNDSADRRESLLFLIDSIYNNASSLGDNEDLARTNCKKARVTRCMGRVGDSSGDSGDMHGDGDSDDSGDSGYSGYSGDSGDSAAVTMVAY
jgi:hypothetical protein